MGSQEKFVGNGKEVSSLLSIRDELYRNTLQIIELVRDRLRLAEEIGREKELLGMPPRNRERELEVLRSIPELGEIEKSILNMIFELTILNETSDKPRLQLPDSPGADGSDIVLTGPENLLMYSMGLIVSFPGFELRDRIGIPENLALGVIQRGGHITSVIDADKSGGITLADPRGNSLASIENGRLTISRNVFENNAKNHIMEAF